MPDIQQFIIAPDKQTQGTVEDLTRFVAAAKDHPDVQVHKETGGYAKISCTAGVMDHLMQQHGANLIMSVDAMLAMPEPPGPFMPGRTGQIDKNSSASEADGDPEEDNIL
jgi:hypothetical protein